MQVKPQQHSQFFHRMTRQHLPTVLQDGGVLSALPRQRKTHPFFLNVQPSRNCCCVQPEKQKQAWCTFWSFSNGPDIQPHFPAKPSDKTQFWTILQTKTLAHEYVGETPLCLLQLLIMISRMHSADFLTGLVYSTTHKFHLLHSECHIRWHSHSKLLRLYGFSEIKFSVIRSKRLLTHHHWPHKKRGSIRCPSLNPWHPPGQSSSAVESALGYHPHS